MTTLEITAGDPTLSARAQRLLTGSSAAALQSSYRLEILGDEVAAERAAVSGLAEQLTGAIATVASANMQLATLEEDARRLSVIEDVDAEGRAIRPGLAIHEGRGVDTSRPHVTRSALRAAEANVQRAVDRRERVRAQLASAERAAKAKARPLEAARQALHDHKGDSLEVVTAPKPPKGVTSPGDILTVLTTEIANLRSRHTEVENTPPAAETIKAKLRSELDAVVADGGIKALPDGRISWPVGGGQYSSAPGDRLKLRAMFVRLAYDELLLDLESQVDRQYANVAETMTAQQKAAAMQKLDNAILDAERTAAAACWQAREEGIDIAFPAGISGKAILGIA